MISKPPPHNAETEKHLLGTLMMAPDIACSVMAILRDADAFYAERHSLVYAAALRLVEQSKPCDMLSVVDELERRGDLKKAGGYSYLGEMTETQMHPRFAEGHARRIAELATLRKARELGQLMAIGADSTVKLTDYLDDMSHRLSALAPSSLTGLERAGVVADRAMREIERRYDLKSEVVGLPTGLMDLDRLLACLQAGDLVVLAGRPSMGKTMEALQWATNAAENSKKPVAFFSLEMSKEQLLMRLFASVGGVDGKDVRIGNIANHVAELTSAAARIESLPLFIDDAGSTSMFDVRSKCSRLATEHGEIGMVVIDYLQLMSSRTRGDNREREISENARAAKLLAKEFGCPVVLLSQLNREVERRSNKRPMMSDLRESGAIEQDADVIVFVYRDEVYNPDTTEDHGVMENIVAKQRNGPIGTVYLRYDDACGRLSNLSNYGRYEK